MFLGRKIRKKMKPFFAALSVAVVVSGMPGLAFAAAPEAGAGELSVPLNQDVMDLMGKVGGAAGLLNEVDRCMEESAKQLTVCVTAPDGTVYVLSDETEIPLFKGVQYVVTVEPQALAVQMGWTVEKLVFNVESAVSALTVDPLTGQMVFTATRTVVAKAGAVIDNPTWKAINPNAATQVAVSQEVVKQAEAREAAAAAASSDSGSSGGSGGGSSSRPSTPPSETPGDDGPDKDPAPPTTDTDNPGEPSGGDGEDKPGDDSAGSGGDSGSGDGSGSDDGSGDNSGSGGNSGERPATPSDAERPGGSDGSGNGGNSGESGSGDTGTGSGGDSGSDDGSGSGGDSGNDDGTGSGGVATSSNATRVASGARTTGQSSSGQARATKIVLFVATDDRLKI